MTTLYFFHPLIDAGASADTLLLPFGMLWDGDAGGGAANIYYIMQQS